MQCYPKALLFHHHGLPTFSERTHMLNGLVKSRGPDRPRPNPSRTMFAAVTSRDRKACGCFAKDLVDLFERTAADDRETIVETGIQPVEKPQQATICANRIRAIGDVQQGSIQVEEQAGTVQQIMTRRR